MVLADPAFGPIRVGAGEVGWPSFVVITVRGVAPTGYRSNRALRRALHYGVDHAADAGGAIRDDQHEVLSKTEQGTPCLMADDFVDYEMATGLKNPNAAPVFGPNMPSAACAALSEPPRHQGLVIQLSRPRSNIPASAVLTGSYTGVSAPASTGCCVCLQIAVARQTS
jgi:hypothetical protein